MDLETYKAHIEEARLQRLRELRNVIGLLSGHLFSQFHQKISDVRILRLRDAGSNVFGVSWFENLSERLRHCYDDCRRVL